MIFRTTLCLTGTLLCLTVLSALAPGRAHGLIAYSGQTQTSSLSSISPIKADAGGPGITLTLHGSNFTSGSAVQWTSSGTTTLATTFVSDTQLTAAVPASLLGSPGTAQITVLTPGAGVSNARTFTILVTSLQIKVTMSWNTDGEFTALLDIQNIGYQTAQNLSITQATLGGVPTDRPLPLSIGDLAAGATLRNDVGFPGSAGARGSAATLKVSGSFTGGTFTRYIHVKLP